MPLWPLDAKINYFANTAVLGSGFVIERLDFWGASVEHGKFYRFTANRKIF